MTHTQRGAIIVGSLLLVPFGVLVHGLIRGFTDLRDADAATRATMIAQTISEALNCFAIAAPIVALFVLIGFVLWAKRRRLETPISPVPRDTRNNRFTT
ncbi:MAG: hypothetical protein J0L92_32275 [Deltaproteobacteria bacterium]|nr:hypothetical protein [Deltaproteobacteria bacterium]